MNKETALAEAERQLARELDAELRNLRLIARTLEKTRRAIAYLSDKLKKAEGRTA